jgi:hypothetical protein
MSPAERARRHKAKLIESGLVQVNLWVPAGCVAELQRAAELMRENPELRIARLASQKTGKLCGLK